MIELFQRWKEAHRRVYRHVEEAERRLENFRRNLKYIIERNAERSRASPKAQRLGLNRFADMSNEEFNKMYISKVKKPVNKRSNTLISRSMQGKLQSCDAPSTLDWRNKGIVTPIKDQGSCGKFLYDLG